MPNELSNIIITVLIMYILCGMYSTVLYEKNITVYYITLYPFEFVYFGLNFPFFPKFFYSSGKQMWKFSKMDFQKGGFESI